MAVRTTYAAVIKIIEVDVNVTSDLVPFIEVANMLVTDICTNYDTAYTDAKLELIERWLTAHFYAIRDQRKDTERAGPVSESNQYKVDLNLAQTIYGQQAMLLDTEGGLGALNKKITTGTVATPSFEWVGTEDWGLD